MNEQFFIQEVKARERSLYRVAISYLHRDQDAADAVQEALMISWENGTPSGTPISSAPG